MQLISPIIHSHYSWVDIYKAQDDVISPTVSITQHANLILLLFQYSN
jgi:hypothetical protein